MENCTVLTEGMAGLVNGVAGWIPSSTDKSAVEHIRSRFSAVEEEIVIDDLGGAKVRLARRNNIVRIEAMLPELAESVNWTVQLSNRDLGNEFIPPSAYSLIEGLILDYRVALNGRL